MNNILSKVKVKGIVESKVRVDLKIFKYINEFHSRFSPPKFPVSHYLLIYCLFAERDLKSFSVSCHLSLQLRVLCLTTTALFS